MDLKINAAAASGRVTGNDGKPLPREGVDRERGRADAPTGNSMPAQADNAIHQVEAYLRAHDQSVRFQRDQQTGMTIVHVYNKATGEVVRQIPTEEIVRIAQFLQQKGSVPALDVKA